LAVPVAVGSCSPAIQKLIYGCILFLFDIGMVAFERLCAVRVTTKRLLSIQSSSGGEDAAHCKFNGDASRNTGLHLPGANRVYK
jgi:hypothetical protein